MKVNIQYSIELDEIPEKVREFLQGGSASLADIVHDIDDIVSCMKGSFSIEKALEQIDKVRRDLANIDHTMLDCTEILHGYQKALVQLRENKETTQVDPAETLQTFNIEKYSEQLKALSALSNSMENLTEGNHDNETRNEEIEEG